MAARGRVLGGIAGAPRGPAGAHLTPPATRGCGEPASMATPAQPAWAAAGPEPSPIPRHDARTVLVVPAPVPSQAPQATSPASCRRPQNTIQSPVLAELPAQLRTSARFGPLSWTRTQVCCVRSVLRQGLCTAVPSARRTPPPDVPTRDLADHPHCPQLGDSTPTARNTLRSLLGLCPVLPASPPFTQRPPRASSEAGG